MAIVAALGSYSTPYVPLARMRLLDPLTVIHSAFGPMEVGRSWKDDTKKLFSFASEEDRLNVGPMLMDQGDIAFGVSRTRPI
jgi:hypothetical protein